MLEIALRIGFSLLVVFGLMWALAKVAKRPLAGRGGAAMSVLARQQLTRSASVAVIRVADRALVVGVSEGQVTLLGETDLVAMEQQLAGPAAIREAVALDGPGSLDSSADPDCTPAPNGDATTPAPHAGAPALGRLAGSLLSPATWRFTVDFLRDRTVRR